MAGTDESPFLFSCARGRIIMTRRETYEQRTTQLIDPVLAENGFELVDVEYVKEGSTWYLRAYIDKPGGITIGDCETVSRYLSDRLDEEDFIPDAYVLEVSSPGLDRPLKKDKDYQKALGSEIDVKLYRAMDGKKEYSGVLRSYDDRTLLLEDEEGKELRFSREDVALARLTLHF